jgi:hypothetical protein
MPSIRIGWFRRKNTERTGGADWQQYRQQRIQQEREWVLQVHGKFGLELLDILARHDPLRIVTEANPAEYEPVVRTILPRLRAAHCVEDAQRLVLEELVHWLGELPDGQKSSCGQLGEEVWEATKRLGFS